MTTETHPAGQPDATASRRPVIRVFEPALCCNTGVCGTDPEQALVDFTADLNHLRSRGADIARHNLATDPQAFVDDPVASSFIRVAGSAGLPLVVVDGVTVAAGAYPDRARLEALAGLADAQAAAPEAGQREDLGLSAASSPASSNSAASGGCCGGGSC
jgi:hypothetical protein